jgi:hypothetical protein
VQVALNRVILYVQDVDRLAAFYQQAFGLRVVEEIKGEWCVLDAGPCQLALHRVGKAYRVADPASWEVESNAKLVMTVDRRWPCFAPSWSPRACRWAKSSRTRVSLARCATGETRKAMCFSWLRRPLLSLPEHTRSLVQRECRLDPFAERPPSNKGAAGFTLTFERSLAKMPIIVIMA